MSGGWIRLHRKIRDNPVVWCDEPFSHAQAWIDLIMRANYEDKDMMFDGKIVSVKRGSFITSVRKLAKDWSWSNDKTLEYLRVLENEGMIQKFSDSRRTLLIIVNYDFYQELPNAERTPSERRANAESSQLINKELQEVNKDISSLDNSLNTTEIDIDSEELSKESSNKKVGQGKFDWLVDEWNTLSQYSIAKISKISASGTRIKLITARLNDYGEDGFKVAIDNVRHSKFLQGKNKTGWQITFDWMIKPNNFVKVYEGNYTDKESGGVNDIEREVDSWL